MSIYITRTVGGFVQERACFGGLFAALSERDFDGDDDWDNEVVYFCSADRCRTIGRSQKDFAKADAAWAALVEWFFPNYEPHFIGTDNLTDPDTIEALFYGRGYGYDDDRACNIPIYPQEAMKVAASYLPLACHIIRAPYVAPQAILLWHDMVKGGFTPEDALRLAFNLIPVGGVKYVGMETRGWVSQYADNRDVNIPFSGEEYTMLSSREKLGMIDHDYCLELSMELFNGTKRHRGLALEHTKVEVLYQVRPDLREEYGDSPSYKSVWGNTYGGIKAVEIRQPEGRMTGILTDTKGTALSLAELRDILYS